LQFQRLISNGTVICSGSEYLMSESCPTNKDTYFQLTMSGNKTGKCSVEETILNYEIDKEAIVTQRDNVSLISFGTEEALGLSISHYTYLNFESGSTVWKNQWGLTSVESDWQDLEVISTTNVYYTSVKIGFKEDQVTADYNEISKQCQKINCPPNIDCLYHPFVEVTTTSAPFTATVSRRVDCGGGNTKYWQWQESGTLHKSDAGPILLDPATIQTWKCLERYDNYCLNESKEPSTLAISHPNVTLDQMLWTIPCAAIPRQ